MSFLPGLPTKEPSALPSFRLLFHDGKLFVQTSGKTVQPVYLGLRDLIRMLPNSLMIGFTTDYDGGMINIDPDEIAHADWFSADTLPRIPDTYTIARTLIDRFIAKTTTGL